MSDLSEKLIAELVDAVRAQLRKEHGFPRGEVPFGVDCVFCPERLLYPRRDGSVGKCREPGTTLRLDCESGYGTACFVTGAFGFAAAGHIVRRLAGSG